MKTIRISRHPAGIVVIAALLLAAATWLLPPGAVWITDNGNKYIVMRNVLETGSLAIESAEPEFFPRGGFHFLRYRDGIHSFHAPWFALLSAPFYRIFGERGVVVLPLLSLLALLGVFQYLYRNRLLTLLLALATPLWFYSLLLWEMVPAALITLMGAALVIFRAASGEDRFSGTVFAGGAILGCGLWLREELYIAAAALTLAMLLCRRWRGALALFGGFVVAAAPLWLTNLLCFDHILGLHGRYYYLNNRPAGFSLLEELMGTIWNYYHHLLRFDVDVRGGALNLLGPLATAAAVAAGAARKPHDWRVFKFAALMFSGLAGVICAGMLFTHPAPALATGMTAGLWSSVPLFGGFLINWRPLLCSRSPRVRLTARFVTICVLAAPPLFTRNDIGLTWGARHFLMIMPFLLVLSWRGIVMAGFGRRRFVTVLTAVTAGALLIEIWGFTTLRTVTRENRAAEEFIAGFPSQVVVSDIFFLPEQTPRLFFSRQWLGIENDADGEALLHHLEERGVDRFTLVLSPRFRRISDATLAKILTSYPPVAEPVAFSYPNGGGIMELLAVECRRSGE